MPLTADALAVAIVGDFEDKLLFRRMTANERLGRLFTFDVEMLSREEKFAPADVLGKNLTVRLEIEEGEKRYFNGIISGFAQTAEKGTGDRFAVYRAQVRPWLWFLTRSSDCLIFQDMTIPDIVKEIFDDAGYSDYVFKIKGEYKPWEYCVQYRETAFNFVSRLMEQEGMYYFFKHEETKHTLVVCDDPSCHEAGLYPEVPYARSRTEEAVGGDCIEHWTLTNWALPKDFVLEDFDFLQPKRVRDSTSEPDHHVMEKAEIYDYPGEFVRAKEEAKTGDTKAELERYLEVRKDEMHAGYEIFQGEGPVRGLQTGALFGLTDHPHWDDPHKLLVYDTKITLTSGAHETTSAAGAEDVCRCRFKAIPEKQAFRPKRTTPKPSVQGLQTAIVTGPSGEEIHTDKYGRVKVLFHWDRENSEDENSSCWIRVAQMWAGKNWGSMFIPRIGWEVVVEFLEGDPDRPLVTGCVYNADNMPPYSLPDEKTKSTIKSETTTGGGGFNEIRFEDKAGEEEIYVHAQKDVNIEVENDRTRTVMNDETITIQNNRTKTVEVDETIEVNNNRETTIGTDDTLDVGTNLKITAGSEIKLETGASSITMTSGGDITIDGVSITITGSGSITIDASGPLEAKSAAITTIKGSMVQIN